MNDAHVSVYPLDASQLETNAEDPGLQNRNVELSRSVTSATRTPERRRRAWPHNCRDAAEFASHSEPPSRDGGSYRRSCLSPLWRILPRISTTWSRMAVPRICSALHPTRQPTTSTTALTVKLPGGAALLRYRTGYQYAKEPATLKDAVPTGDMAATRCERDRGEAPIPWRLQGVGAQAQHRYQRRGAQATGRTLDRISWISF
jgi:hypothetical protein